MVVNCVCQVCDDLHETIILEHPYQYYSIVEQIKTMLKEGILVLTKGNCDFSLIERNMPFPDDVPCHVFMCSSCESRFKLCVETFHGSGGSWKVIHE
ncbi:MAG: hypothetical protein K0R06_3003 [Clostridium sp.]|jgi:hypothetical protein|nr:hypothetical protein [Clostridium sp.]